MPQLHVLASTEFNSAAPTCDCIAHRFGNAADHPEHVRWCPSDMTDEDSTGIHIRPRSSHRHRHRRRLPHAHGAVPPSADRAVFWGWLAAMSAPVHTWAILGFRRKELVTLDVPVVVLPGGCSRVRRRMSRSGRLRHPRACRYGLVLPCGRVPPSDRARSSSAVQ